RAKRHVPTLTDPLRPWHRTSFDAAPQGLGGEVQLSRRLRQRKEFGRLALAFVLVMLGEGHAQLFAHDGAYDRRESTDEVGHHGFDSPSVPHSRRPRAIVWSLR